MQTTNLKLRKTHKVINPKKMKMNKLEWKKEETSQGKNIDKISCNLRKREKVQKHKGWQKQKT